MTARTRRILTQLGSFVLAGVLLFLALRGVDFSEVLEALREANYAWLVVLVVVAMLSHVLRAWRWQVLLEALPEHTDAPSRTNVSIKTAFYSLMIGYMVNYAAPRLGEVVRTANLSKQERLSFSGVFGTVVVERMLDVIVLALGLASVFFLTLDQSEVFQNLFMVPLREGIATLPVLALLAGTFVGLLFVGLLVRWALRQDRARGFWHQRVQPLLTSFFDGLRTVLRSRRRGVLLVSTAAMWCCYLLMAYIPFLMLDMTATFGLSLLDTWSVMILGALGVAIPMPGGVGSYHYITRETLVLLYGVTEAAAITYAVLTHAAQLILYVIVGGGCLLLQGTSLASVQRHTQEARQSESTPTTAASGDLHHDSPTR